MLNTVNTKSYSNFALFFAEFLFTLIEKRTIWKTNKQRLGSKQTDCDVGMTRNKQRRVRN